MRISAGFAEAERPQVAALYWDAFGAKLHRVLGPDEKALRLVAENAQPQHAFTARDRGGRLIGLAGFQTAQGSFVSSGQGDLARIYGRLGAAWRGACLKLLHDEVEGRAFIVDGLSVAQDRQGEGIGSALVGTLLEEASALGFDEVTLEVVEDNLRARRLYERLGFRVTGHQRIGPARLLFGFRSTVKMTREV